MSSASTKNQLCNLANALKRSQHLFNTRSLRYALKGEMKPVKIIKADAETVKGRTSHILNTTNECFKRYNGTENRLINAACISTIAQLAQLETMVSHLSSLAAQPATDLQYPHCHSKPDQ